jgi:hypothetical protein
MRNTVAKRLRREAKTMEARFEAAQLLLPKKYRKPTPNLKKKVYAAYKRFKKLGVQRPVIVEA